MDRNNNGIIDSIDDTLGLIGELEQKGYKRGTDIEYLELPDGRHDVPTWARAFPDFLKWGWPANKI
jgi:enterochelin esterase-like enzyme